MTASPSFAARKALPRACITPGRNSSWKPASGAYATTIHKSQGATVDRAYVLASATMDRHLTYVAMTPAPGGCPDCLAHEFSGFDFVFE
ncbi:hypothetical protein [Roseibium aggregatum]|uniref:hypothetical protein n=1 Tax=Roseibium aggregatum TaxID=187304 RepID=UPI0009D6E4C3|nr:hypothetical protein [Roseibium aggregatum]